jgi:serine/threonine protein kinase
VADRLPFFFFDEASVSASIFFHFASISLHLVFRLWNLLVAPFAPCRTASKEAAHLAAVRSIAVDVLRGLRALHDRGVAHRDFL